MGKDINLDGAEVLVLKTLGFGGGDISGRIVMDRTGLDSRELIEVMEGLLSVGYISCDKLTLRNAEELQAASFHINSGYVRDLKAAIEPEKREVKSKRVRRE